MGATDIAPSRNPNLTGTLHSGPRALSSAAPLAPMAVNEALRQGGSQGGGAKC